jgi:hypothetical protein
VSKTITILLGVVVLLIAVSAATIHLGTAYDESLLRAEKLRLEEQNSSGSHGGFEILCGGEIVGQRWLNIGGFVLLTAFACVVAAVKIWYQDISEKKESLKEHLAHSRIINIEGRK